jgi:hypothetical protein
MQSITEEEFLKWAEGVGLCISPDYPDSAVLMHKQTIDKLSCFWVTPRQSEKRPYFIKSLLRLLEPWQFCSVWRAMGSWPDQSRVSKDRVNDVVELCILSGLGLPLGTTGIVQFDFSELDSLITLIFTTTIFGWSVAEDIYVVPDHGRQFLYVSHHDVIHVDFRDGTHVETWAKRMLDEGFPLPMEVPDPTFIRPEWMN